MAFRKLFFKRVNESRSNFLLAEGDIALDETTFKLFRGDGSTVGGVAISGLSGVNSISEDTAPSLGGGRPRGRHACRGGAGGRNTQTL